MPINTDMKSTIPFQLSQTSWVPFDHPLLGKYITFANRHPLECRRNVKTDRVDGKDNCASVQRSGPSPHIIVACHVQDMELHRIENRSQALFPISLAAHLRE